MKKLQRLSIAVVTGAALAAGSISPVQAQPANQSSDPLIAAESIVQDVQTQIDRAVADAIRSVISAFPQAAPLLNPLLTSAVSPAPTVRVTDEELVSAVNAARAHYDNREAGVGSTPLTVDADLTAIAQVEAQGLADGRYLVERGNSQFGGGDRVLYVHTYVPGETVVGDSRDASNFHKEPFVKKVQDATISFGYLTGLYKNIGVAQVERDGRIYTAMVLGR